MNEIIEIKQTDMLQAINRSEMVFELRATANAIKEGTTTIEDSFIKPIEERKQALEGDIKMVMGDAEMLCDPKTNFTVATWKKAKDGVKFDDKAFKAEHPDLYNQYLTPKQGARTFLIKKWNEGDILFPA